MFTKDSLAKGTEKLKGNFLFSSDPHADLTAGFKYVKGTRCFPKHFEEQTGHLEAGRCFQCY